MSGRFSFLFLALLLRAYGVSAQDAKPLTAMDRRPVHLDVVVTEKSGAVVRGLQMEDFTLLDNSLPRTITSFEAVDGRQADMKVVLVIDAVNAQGQELAIARQEIKRFLQADHGRLAYPTTFAILTETGVQSHLGFSQDGKAVSSALDHHRIPMRSISRDADRGGKAALFDSSFAGLAQLLAEERDKPGRKLLIWISPGWPVVQNKLDTAQRQHLFETIVELSKQLREGKITVYGVDPSGTGDIEPGMSGSGGSDIHLRAQDQPVYIESARDPSEAGLGNLALSVLAAQSGGMILHPGNDLASDLRKCVGDASAYYEISFHPDASDRPNQYHRLEVRVERPGLTARTQQGYYSQAPLAGFFTAGSEQPDKAVDDKTADKASIDGAAAARADDEIYANARPYVDWPLTQLTERVPELAALRPAPDQQQLPFVLRNMGRTMDDFVRNIGDLIAHEDVTQEKSNADGKIKAKQRVQDNYLILHHSYEWGAGAEYRMDDKGNRLGPVGLSQGYLVTSGYALSCISFSSNAQPQSRFRLLGEEKIGSQDAYVLAFAQRPGEVTFTTVMKGTGGHEVDMLTQGILWVDKSSFQILRMRSDLLAVNKEIQLDRLTTDVTFGEVRLKDVPNPLWLPSDADVHIEIGDERFHNIHRYTDYRRYRVAVKIGAPQ